MNKIFNTMFATARAKVTAIWKKLKLWTSSTFWETKGLNLLKEFFSKLFDIKPRDKKDYYTVFRWLISKRLAYAIVIALGLGSVYLIYVLSPSIFSAGDSTVALRTYKYNSIPLKFYSGTVRILAEDDYIAYVGDVDSGAAVGDGSLYDASGALVYDGQFEDSMYNGTGKLYYNDGTVRYDGDFVDNIFNGTGSYYRQNGVLEYEGGFENGLRSGSGELFNSGANSIFTGTFQMDNLLYSDFVGKTAADAATMYTGESSIYSTDDEYCVEMNEINAVYTVASGDKSLEDEWTIDGIYVLSGTLPVAGKALSTINDLTAYFGEPSYYGTTWVKLPEVVSINQLTDGSELAAVDMETTSSFDNVYDVSEYDTDYEVYIYTYEMDGLLYTFYCGSSSASGFYMYCVQIA